MGKNFYEDVSSRVQAPLFVGSTEEPSGLVRIHETGYVEIRFANRDDAKKLYQLFREGLATGIVLDAVMQKATPSQK